MLLKSVELTLENVTPLFLGGANQEAELRPASVRGVLRYWFRSALALPDIEMLRERETCVFGNTEQCAPVRVRIVGTLEPMQSFALDADRGGHQSRTGHNYFYYATRLGENNRTPFEPIPGYGIKLILSAKPGATNAEALLQQAACAAWLMTHLGGLGMRARRCGGSMQAVAGCVPEVPAFPVTAESADALVTSLGNGLRQIRKVMASAPTPPLKYDALHPDVCRVWVVSGQPAWQDWKTAVNEMGIAMQKFRATGEPDRNVVNAIFGIPILHGPSHSLQRRSSPLWLRVTRLASGEYVGVATLFKADFKEGVREVGGTYALIEQFVAVTLKGKEVNLR